MFLQEIHQARNCSCCRFLRNVAIEFRWSAAEKGGDAVTKRACTSLIIHIIVLHVEQTMMRGWRELTTRTSRKQHETPADLS